MMASEEKKMVDGQLPGFESSSNLAKSQQMTIDLMADTHTYIHTCTGRRPTSVAQGGTSHRRDITFHPLAEMNMTDVL
jgi:hypothetical protein